MAIYTGRIGSDGSFSIYEDIPERTKKYKGSIILSKAQSKRELETAKRREREKAASRISF